MNVESTATAAARVEPASTDGRDPARARVGVVVTSLGSGVAGDHLVVWVILHNRLEAGLGETFHRRWRRAWPPGPVILIALLFASALAFVVADAPPKAKIVPIGLDVLALSVVLFGTWWRLVALPRWLGGAGPLPFFAWSATATRTGA